jgi:hypothetical protein
VLFDQLLARVEQCHKQLSSLPLSASPTATSTMACGPSQPQTQMQTQTQSHTMLLTDDVEQTQGRITAEPLM